MRSFNYGSTFNFSRFWKHGRFFPKQLFLKFKQFDYKDLTLKLKSTSQIDLLNSLSKEVFENINSLLDDEKLISQFKQVMNKKNDQ